MVRRLGFAPYKAAGRGQINSVNLVNVRNFRNFEIPVLDNFLEVSKRTNGRGKMEISAYIFTSRAPFPPKKTKKIIGNEKNKLVIQTIGLVVIEFLIKHFEDIFSYDYTKEMESELDNILQGIII